METFIIPVFSHSNSLLSFFLWSPRTFFSFSLKMVFHSKIIIITKMFIIIKKE